MLRDLDRSIVQRDRILREARTEAEETAEQFNPL